jgi:hypothetical protein
MTIRVLGYVMAKNEWPLLGLAITHALNCDIDHIVVVNHASSDETYNGLQRLKLNWPKRITIINLKIKSYFQEVSSAVILSSVNAHEYDWVYVFDADEFLLYPQKTSFVQLLESIPKNVGAIKYELDQWVTPHDMNDLEMSSYKNIKKRSVPCIFINHPGEILAKLIEKGHVNYFDVPFPQKIIVRGEYAHLLTAGAHGVNAELKLVEQKMDPSVLRVGHLPLLSKRRLKLKAEHGKLVIDEGYPPNHGWQNQALYKLELTGGLETYWRNHSIGGGQEDEQACCVPNTVDDQSLTAALEKAVDSFIEFNQPTQNEMDTEDLVDFSGLENVLKMTHHLQSQYHSALFERNDLVKKVSLLEKNPLEKDASIHALRTRLESIERSTSWRITAPARYLSKKLRFWGKSSGT